MSPSNRAWRRALAGAALLLAGAALAAVPAAAQTAVGEATYVKRWAYHWQPAAERAALHERDAVFMQDTVATVTKGAARLRLEDGSDVRLGPDTELRLTSYVYDPADGSGELIGRMGPGVLRFVTGEIGRGVQLRTPVAVIGVRGTEFDVAVAEDGTTRVDVISGQVEVSPLGAGASVAVPAGRAAEIAGPDSDPQLSDARPSQAPELQATAGLGSSAGPGGVAPGSGGGGGAAGGPGGAQ
jgi:hypothetical protein